MSEDAYVTRTEFAEAFNALHGFIEMGFSRLETEMRAGFAQVDRRLARLDDRVSVLENDMSRLAKDMSHVKTHLGITG